MPNQMHHEDELEQLCTRKRKMQEELESKVDDERRKHAVVKLKSIVLTINQLREERNKRDAHEKENAQAAETQRGLEEEKAKRTLVEIEWAVTRNNMHRY